MKKIIVVLMVVAFVFGISENYAMASTQTECNDAMAEAAFAIAAQTIACNLCIDAPTWLTCGACALAILYTIFKVKQADRICSEVDE